MASSDLMTSDQLKEHLYHEMQSRGVLETMKSQLRQKIAKELHEATPTGVKRSKPKKSNSKRTTLDDHMAVAMVADYLKKAGFEYSLSVFLPEAGVNVEKLCTMDDLVQYLRIPASSSLHSKLIPSRCDQSMLDQLLKALVDSGTGGDQASSPCPKSDSNSPHQRASPRKREPKKISVVEQLQALDQSYALKAEEQRVRTQQNLEERLLTFQQELEAQHKTQLETELSLYKSRELAKVRLEEREKYEQELTSERIEATVTHQRKIEELRKAEQQMMERYRKKEQELEASTHSQRQTLLAELNSLKMREAELKRQAELNNRTTSLEEERLNKLAQQLTGRERTLEKAKTHFESMVEEKAHKFKLELESQLQSKQNELARWEAELKRDSDKMASLQSQLTKLEAELQAERDKANQLQSLLHEAMGRQITLQGQKDTLQQKADQMGNYDRLQQRSQELTRELENTEKKLQEYRRRNADSQRLIKDLQSKISHPTRELDALKKELDEIRVAHHKKLFVMERNSGDLRRQLATQAGYADKLQKKLDDQMVQLLSAQREVKDLHAALEQSRLGGGRSGARKNQTAPINRTAMTKKKTPLMPTAHSATPPPLMTSQGPHLSQPHTLQAELISLTPHLDHTPTADVSSQLLAESRATIERLEKEAQELEATCHHLQQNRHTPPLSLPANNRGSTDLPSSPMITSHVRAYGDQELNATACTLRAMVPSCLGVSQELPLSAPMPAVWNSSQTTVVHTVIPDDSSRQPSPIGLSSTHNDTSTVTLVSTKPMATPLQQSLTPLPAQPVMSPSQLPSIVEQSSQKYHTGPLDSTVTTSEALPTTKYIPRVSTAPPTTTLNSVIAPTQTKPPNISLDELWKASEVNSPPTRAANTSVPSKEISKEDELQEDDKQDLLHIAPTVQVPPPTQKKPPDSRLSSQKAPDEDEGVDPMMLKYMELVKQGRGKTQTEPREIPVDGEEANSKMDFGIPSLSQVSENFSDKDDPFEDW